MGMHNAMVSPHVVVVSLPLLEHEVLHVEEPKSSELLAAVRRQLHELLHVTETESSPKRKKQKLTKECKDGRRQQ